MDRIIMDELIITKERIDEFRNYLRLEEKSENTIEKYMNTGDYKGTCDSV